MENEVIPVYMLNKGTSLVKCMIVYFLHGYLSNPLALLYCYESGLSKKLTQHLHDGGKNMNRPENR